MLNGKEKCLLPKPLPVEIRGAERGSVTEPVSAGNPEFPVSLQEKVAEMETALISAALQESGGNLSQTAVLLQTTRRILKYKMDQYGLSAE